MVYNLFWTFMELKKKQYQYKWRPYSRTSEKHVFTIRFCKNWPLFTVLFAIHFLAWLSREMRLETFNGAILCMRNLICLGIYIAPITTISERLLVFLYRTRDWSNLSSKQIHVYCRYYRIHSMSPKATGISNCYLTGTSAVSS